MLHVFGMTENNIVRVQGIMRYKHTKGIYHKNSIQQVSVFFRRLMGRHGDFQVLKWSPEGGKFEG